MDVTVESECKGLVAETVKRHGRVDILVNNAGGGANNGVPPNPPDEMAVEGFRKVIEANLTRTFMVSQAAYPEMKKAGGGKIINVGSMASYIHYSDRGQSSHCELSGEFGDVVGAVRIRRTVPHPIQAASDSKEQLIASHTQCIRAQSRTR
jgi:NAD(P)-dependent dehydrogenase (short-subunit alcohol dehydrogenase family)